MAQSPLRIAIFDYRVVKTNPVGSCHLRMLAGLCHQYEFTVFAVEFDNPCPERIGWVRVPAPIRPYVLLYVTYHVLAPIAYWLHRTRHRARFDVVQFVESNLVFGDVAYSHFCHRAYLRNHWRDSAATGVRGALRFIAHRIAAWMEPLVYRGVRHIVVPSRGLDREIAAAYQNSAAKARVLPNPVDVEQMRMPDDFDRNAMRTRLGYLPEDLVLIFIALGHFERKGLPLLLNSLKSLGNQRIRLLVVGGTQDTVDWWRGRINQLELAGRVQLLGMQSDVRPYLWSSDVFTLPSYYEVFPLVALEAAAAGLPLLVTSLNGVEEFLIPEKNGLLVERTAESMTGGLKRLGALPEQALREMGRRAQEDVQQYATRHFVSRWRDFYEASYVVG